MLLLELPDVTFRILGKYRQDSFFCFGFESKRYKLATVTLKHDTKSLLIRWLEKGVILKFSIKIQLISVVLSSDSVRQTHYCVRSL